MSFCVYVCLYWRVCPCVLVCIMVEPNIRLIRVYHVYACLLVCRVDVCYAQGGLVDPNPILLLVNSPAEPHHNCFLEEK